MKSNYEKYLYVDPRQVKDIFEEHKLQIPRDLRVKALKEVISPVLNEEFRKLKEKEETTGKLLSLGESSRLLRVSYPDHLSEFQLEAEYESLKRPELKKKYLLILWESMLSYLSEMNGEGIIDQINNLQEDISVFNELCIPDYNMVFHDIFRDEEGYSDGLHHSEYRTYLYRSTNIKELRKIGDKYDLDIPKYFTKDDLKVRLYELLDKLGLLTNEMKEEIEGYGVKKIKEKLAENGGNSRSHLTKEEIVEYILENNHQLKYFYEKPVEEDVYGLEEDKVEVVEEVKEEKQEEVVAPLRTENVVVDFTELKEELQACKEQQAEILKELKELQLNQDGGRKRRVAPVELQYIQVLMLMAIIILIIIL